jgi:hypothetical protein
MMKNANKLQLQRTAYRGTWCKDSLLVEVKENAEKGIRKKRRHVKERTGNTINCKCRNTQVMCAEMSSKE